MRYMTGRIRGRGEALVLFFLCEQKSSARKWSSRCKRCYFATYLDRMCCCSTVDYTRAAGKKKLFVIVRMGRYMLVLLLLVGKVPISVFPNISRLVVGSERRGQNDRGAAVP